MKTEIRPTKAQLARLAARHRFGRYPEDPDVPASSARKLLLAQLEDLLGRPETQRASLPGANALALFRISSWDSRHFGYPFAIIDALLCSETAYARRRAQAEAVLAAVGAGLRRQRARVITLRVSALDLAVIHALEKDGFQFIESWIHNKIDLRRPTPAPQPPCPLRLSRPEDEGAMLSFCRGAFDTQRFHADPRFGRAKAESLYLQWIKSSFRNPAHKTFVHDVEGRPAAFMTTFVTDQRELLGATSITWRMALLDPNQRGKGLGRRFFYSLMARHRADGIDLIDSGLTMRNTASLNLHDRSGFKTVATMITFHKWLY